MAMAAGPDKYVEAAAGRRLQKSYFDVLGLCCSSEVPLIETILKSIDGVKEYSVIVPTRTLVVVHDGLVISQLQIVKALNQAGLEASVRAYGNAKYQKKWPSPYAVACCLLLLVSLFKYFYHPLVWVALGAVAIGIIPILLKALASLRNLRPDTNLLVLIAVMGTIAMNDYIEAGTIVFLFTIAEWLESRASHKATAVMESLMNIAPQKAVIAETGEQVDAKEVELNTVLAVKTGDVIPIDGIVVDGECEVDEKALTGESFPVYKQKDSNVLAGTINLNGYISVKTTALAGDCVVAKMAKLVEEAQNNKSRTQRFIDKFAQYYTPAVVIISASIAVVPLALPKEAHKHKHWFHLALVVLVSACPCALVLSTPVATFCALTKAALSGLVIKGGGHLETLAKIKTIAFDKTGTITRGEFIVKDFKSVSDDVSLDVLLYWVSSIESKSSHPMAAALVDYGRSISIESKPENVRDFQNFPGEGVHGRIDGKDIYIGNKKIARRAGSQTVPILDGDTNSGRSIGYVYCGATPAGIFCLSDACRTGVVEAIKELKSMAIKTVMLTGDSQAAALHAQEELGNAFDEIHAELLPEDKARYIKGFKEKGPTAMIGDGINDAPALASADIGISMGISGSDLATETGHVILMSNDIRKVPKVIRLARYSYRKVIENVIISVAAKSAVLALAFFGHPLVWAAVLADVGTCLLVIFNSMLLLRGTSNPEGKCYKSSAAARGCNSAAEPPQNHRHSCSNSMVDKGCLHWFTSCSHRCQSKDPGMKACGNNMCTDTANGKVEFVGAIEINNHEEMHHDHDTCNMVRYNDIMAKVSHKNGCPERQSLCSKKRKKIASSVEVGAACMTGNNPNESKCCHLKCCEIVSYHGIINCSIHSANLEEGQKRSNKALSHPSFSNNDHHDNMQIDESSGKIVQSNCNQKAESYHDLKIHCDEQVHTTFGASNGQESDETTMEACMNLDKRGAGCCCKSYVKEYCCSKQGRCEGIASGLSEIVTE